jgi:plasmid maintenance system antidote protein VapI
MAFNKSGTGSVDRVRINIHEDCDLRFWAEQFGVTAPEIKNAVKRAGTVAADVARRLGARF